MAPPYRVFISSPLDNNLLPNEVAFKHGLYDLIRYEGFEPQCFGEAGIPVTQNMRWSVDNVKEVMSLCQGTVVIGFPRWQAINPGPALLTEYSHCEGTLSLTQQLPTLLIHPDNVSERGIMDASQYLTAIPQQINVGWLTTPSFVRDFSNWRDQVKARYHVFMGYSSGAKDIAQRIIALLRRNNVTVLDWMTDFQLGGTILAQIKQAERLCLGGIFLFTKDDDLNSGNISYAAPRDNVILEAGYFIAAKSDKRVLILREEGAKMPADVGGQIYLPLKDRKDRLSYLKKDLLRFIQERL